MGGEMIDSDTAPEDRPAWVRAWDDMVALIGTDLSDGSTLWGVDPVEASTVRRFLEPLELESAIHYDHDAARENGFTTIVAPATSLLGYTVPAMWQPGDPPLFASDERDAQPVHSPINNDEPGPGPRTSGYFATDIEMDFVRAVTVGERLGTRGRRLLSCTPKETRVGQGAFSTVEYDIVSNRGDVVARVRQSMYAYEPRSEEVADDGTPDTPAG